MIWETPQDREQLKHWFQGKALATYAQFKDAIPVKSFSFWFGSAVAGVAIVLFSYAFRGIEQASYQLLIKHPIVFAVLSPICLWLSWWIVHKYAPQSRGSGIPQVMLAIELSETQTTPQQSDLIDKLTSIQCSIIKVISSLLCLLGGGMIGREGPSVQISVSIFQFFGKIFKKHFQIRPDPQALIIAGGAAGIAAAFNTPLGGIVFAIEELIRSKFVQFRTAIITSVVVAGLVAQGLVGPYLYLGYPRIVPFGHSMAIASILVGAASGWFGGMFGKLLAHVNAKKSATFVGRHTVIFILLVSAFLTLSGVFGDPMSLWGGHHLISDLLFQREDPKFILVIIRTLGTFLSYLVGAAGGIFAPALAMGASFGAFIANLVSSDHATLYTLLGMIGFLSGMTHAPFTAFVLVLEMTDRHSAIFPMMLAALTSYATSRLVGKDSFYSVSKNNFRE